MKALIGLCIAMFAGIIVVGLNPRHSFFLNKVSRIPGAAGIRFQKYGIAYTIPFDPIDLMNSIDAAESIDRVDPALGRKKFEPEEFSFEIAFRSNPGRKNGSGFIGMFHDGDDRTQMLIRQWRTFIIVMNGDDYEYRRKDPRISTDFKKLSQKTVVAVVTSGNGGTRLYLNGRFILERKNLRLTLPGGERRSRLVLGNSVYGNQSWEGDIFGFALYPYVMEASDVSRHYGRWLADHDFSFAMDQKPSLLYLFDKTDGRRVIDKSGRGHHLEIPPRAMVLKRQVLTFSIGEFSWKPDFVEDFVINFVGFMPLGLILAMILRRLYGPYGNHPLLIAVMTGFIVSLTIEIAQSWIPSRNSSLLDLVLNTAGTGSGACLRGMLCRRLPYAFRIHFGGGE